jgi:hypothetical protein
LTPKVLLRREETWSIAVGLGILLPTARRSTLGTVTVENEAVHLQPFIGGQWQPNDRLFSMLVTGCDFDTHGRPVYEGGAFDGRIIDQNLIYVDWKTGYWLYQNYAAPRLKGIAPTLELHYTAAMTDGAAVNTTTMGAIGPEVAGIGRWSNLDLTAGLHFLIGQSLLTVYGSAPLRYDYNPDTGALSSYFSEFGVQFDRRF